MNKFGYNQPKRNRKTTCVILIIKYNNVKDGIHISDILMVTCLYTENMTNKIIRSCEMYNKTKEKNENLKNTHEGK